MFCVKNGVPPIFPWRFYFWLSFSSTKITVCQKWSTPHISLEILFFTIFFLYTNHCVSEMEYPLYLTWDFIFDWSFFSTKITKNGVPPIFPLRFYFWLSFSSTKITVCQKWSTPHISLEILFFTIFFLYTNHCVSEMEYPLYLTWDFIFDWSFFSTKITKNGVPPIFPLRFYFWLSFSSTKITVCQKINSPPELIEILHFLLSVHSSTAEIDWMCQKWSTPYI